MDLTEGLCSYFLVLFSLITVSQSQQISLHTQSLMHLLRQERPGPRNQSHGMTGSPSDTVYYIPPKRNQRPSPRLYDLPFAAYTAYDGETSGAPYGQEYLPHSADRKSYNDGHMEIGVELAYEPYREYQRPYVEIHRSSYPSKHGYDAYASPYHRHDVSYYPQYTAHYFTPKHQNYRDEYDEHYEHGRIPARSGYGGPGNNLYLGLYDSPNVVPYNVHDYKKYPYGYSRAHSGAKSFGEYAQFDATVHHPVAYHPRSAVRRQLEKRRPNPGLNFDREPLAAPPVVTLQPAAKPPVNQPLASFFSQLLRSYSGGGAEGSGERSEGYEAEKMGRHFLPYLMQGMRF